MSQLRPILAGLACRCPGCGNGPLYDGFLTLRPRCSSCDAALDRATPADGATTFVILIIGALGCLGIAVTEGALDWPIWLSCLVWLPLIAVLSVLALRPFKGAMVGAQFRAEAAGAKPAGEPVHSSRRSGQERRPF